MKDQIRDDGSLELWFGVGSYPAAITFRPDQLALLRTALGLGPGTEEASPPREPEAGDTVMVRDFAELPWQGPLVLQLRRDGAFEGDPRPRWRAGGADWAHCRYATVSDELLPRDRLMAKAMDAGRKLTDAMLGNPAQGSTESLPTDFVAIPRAPTCGEPEPGDLVVVCDREEDPWAGFRVLSGRKSYSTEFPLCDTNGNSWRFARHLTEEEIDRIKRI